MAFEKNPLAEIIEDAGITPLELAMVAGCDVARVRDLLRGGSPKLSGKVLETLESLGYYGDYVAYQYLEWRKKQARSAKKKLQI